MQNILGNELNPFKFQEKIIKKIQNKNALVCIPTGSGKSLIAMNFSTTSVKTYLYNEHHLGVQKNTIIHHPGVHINCFSLGLCPKNGLSIGKD